MTTLAKQNDVLASLAAVRPQRREAWVRQRRGRAASVVWLPLTRRCEIWNAELAAW